MNRILTCALVSVLMVFVGTLSLAVADGPECQPNFLAQPGCFFPHACGPSTCCGLPDCRPNPLTMILSGTVRVVTGVIALPFRVVDSVLDQVRCEPRFCPPPVAMCPQPFCPPPVCGTPFGPPASVFGYGATAQLKPIGFVSGLAERYSTVGQKSKMIPLKLVATPGGGFFGAYW